MRRRAYVARSLAMGMVCMAALAEARADFREPSAIPAMSTHLAAQRPLMAVATAGSRLVTVGRKGHILCSDDMGKSWTQAEVPVSVDLTSVRFVNSKLGWATGQDGILLHTDTGGSKWTVALEGRQVAKQLVDFYSSMARSKDGRVAAALDESKRFLGEDGARPFLDVWFQDEQKGFVVGAFGLILKTEDAGKHWSPWLHRVENANAGHFNSIEMAEGHLWIVGERGLLLRMDPNGARFTAVKAPITGSLFGLISKPGLIVTFGLVGRAYISRDGGMTWARAGSLGGSGITDATVLADGRLILVDTAAAVWVSSNDGRTFAAVRVEQPMPYFSVTATQDNALVLAGAFGVQRQPLGR